MDKFSVLIALALSNFSLTMFLLALIFIILHRCCMQRITTAEVVYRWMVFFALGCTGIYGFIMHAFYPVYTAATIGWSNSPFQFEVAVADLAVGVLGVLSFNASYGFRLATAIGAACLLWGDAYGHIIQMVQQHNFSVGNAGSWLWMDILVPLILLICVSKPKTAAIKR